MWLCRIVLLAAITLIQEIHGSHFRGAMIYWKQSAAYSDRIDIDYRQAWRRTSLTPLCDDDVKNNGTLMSNGVLTVADSPVSYQYSVPFDFQCTDYSILEDWTSGKGHANFTPAMVNSEKNMFFVRFSSCCWIASINDMYATDWSLMMVVNTSVRADKNRMNQSPRVDMAPIKRLQYGCNHTISIPVSDADGDDIRCRWAQSTKGYDECGGACGTFTNAVLDERACTITYDAHYNLGWYAVAVQIEDFSTKTSNIVLSSIPLQFLVSVENNAANCTIYKKERPTFIGITLPDKACVGVTNSTDFTTDIFIDSKLNSSISELTTISPIGLVKSSLQRVNATGTWHVNVKWNPNGTDSVNNVFCFTAIDNNGLSSDQRCVTLLAGVPPPVLIPSTRSPMVSPVSRYQQYWSMEFDQFGKRPDKPAYVYLYKADGSLVESVDVSNPRQAAFSDGVHGTSVRFETTAPLQPGEEYFFQLGRGVVQGKTYCGAESAAIVDPYFWRFTVEQLPQTQLVTVRCDQRYVTVPCKESDLNCTENWNFANPCNQADLYEGKTKFPHPVSADKFILCDDTGKVYIAYCPQGEKFDRYSSECAAMAWDYGLDEPR